MAARRFSSGAGELRLLLQGALERDYDDLPLPLDTWGSICCLNIPQQRCIFCEACAIQWRVAKLGQLLFPPSAARFQGVAGKRGSTFVGTTTLADAGDASPYE